MTRMFKVQGMRCTMQDMVPIEIDVRVSSDKHGKSISLSDGETLLLVPVEPLKGFLDVDEDGGFAGRGDEWVTTARNGR